MPIPAIQPYAMPTELPANQVAWQLEPHRAVLLIHDMQRYFAGFFPPGAPPLSELIANIRAIRQRADRLGVPVIYTAQPGDMTPAERGLLHDFWGPGMSSGESSRAIVDELAPAAGDVIITKWRYSAFARTKLESHLRDLGRDQLIICGVYAHVGCLMTACDAFTEDIQPFVVADAIADFTKEEHQMALEYVTRRCGVTLPAAHVLGVTCPSDGGSATPRGRV
ncbi:isochorismatase family protein [Nonomuraea typhae]|uniref:Isochorismatase family protein n=1 Tax=Nonomuraea typhae TaxID=2603600 RepID=A0ABW7YQ55_9ACTN